MKKSFKRRYKTNRYYFVWMLRLNRLINESTQALEKAIARVFGSL